MKDRLEIFLFFESIFRAFTNFRSISLFLSVEEIFISYKYFIILHLRMLETFLLACNVETDENPFFFIFKVGDEVRESKDMVNIWLQLQFGVVCCLCGNELFAWLVNIRYLCEALSCFRHHTQITTGTQTLTAAFFARLWNIRICIELH